MNKVPLKIDHTEVIPKTPVRFIRFLSRSNYKFVCAGLLTVTLAQAFSVAIPYVIGSLIDTASAFTDSSQSLESVWFWVILYLILTFAMFICWRISGLLGLEWASRINANAYATLFKHLSKHGYTYFSNRFAGSLSSKMSHASEGAQSLGESFLWQYYPSVVSLIFTVILIGTSSLVSALLFLLLIGILIPLNFYLTKYRRPHLIKYTEQVTKTRGLGVDSITNMAAVRQFAREEYEHVRFTDAVKMMRNLNVRQWRINELSLLINNVLIVFFLALILISSVMLWAQGTITLGDLVMVIALLANIEGTLVFIGMSMNRFIRQYAEIEEGLGDILISHDIIDTENAQSLVVKKGEISWQNVTFGYEGKTVFKDFNLTIRNGERIGLVGTSGAGKTTFVSLLLRQHDLDSGAILIDGQNIQDVQQQSLRDHITIVPQEPMLFHRSIRENIAYGKPEATQEEIETAALRAHATSFIEGLPAQYETLVGERGVKLSGGQKQRVAIARAMLKDAPIIVLDEATSALDSESEIEIQKALHELMVGKTVIAIAHRLSTLREMDRIIVLQNGKIIEDGSHTALIKNNGQYAKLWSHQAGGFLPEAEAEAETIDTESAII